MFFSFWIFSPTTKFRKSYGRWIFTSNLWCELPFASIRLAFFSPSKGNWNRYGLHSIGVINSLLNSFFHDSSFNASFIHYLPFSDFASIKRWVCIHIFHYIISFPCTHINPNIIMANSYDSLLTWRSSNTAPPKEFIRCRKASPFKLLFFVYFRSTLMDSCVIFRLEGTFSSFFLSSFF